MDSRGKGKSASHNNDSARDGASIFIESMATRNTNVSSSALAVTHARGIPSGIDCQPVPSDTEGDARDEQPADDRGVDQRARDIELHQPPEVNDAGDRWSSPLRLGLRVSR